MSSDASTLRFRSRGFTLVEILIVVVILGILAALVTPQFVRATESAAETTALDQLGKVRRALAVYYTQHNTYPTVTAGDGTWGEILTLQYLREAPINPWITGVNHRLITIASSPDTSYHTSYGWIYDSTTGSVWAAGFNGEDQPFPRP